MEAKVFKTGEPVTAEFMTEVSQTVALAERKSKLAADESQLAVNTSQQASTKADEAADKSDSALKASGNAESNAALALEKASAVEQMAVNHRFDGAPGVITEAKGLFAFQIENGELCVYYEGEEKPNLSIDPATGELIYNF